jgi:anti-sigma28 factor (negative regulator of flagellin synthesis)
MKINETKEIVALRGVATAGTQKVGVREDRVTAQATESALKAIAAVRQNTGSRSARLEALAAAIEAGTYQPDPNLIAQEILEDAELIARLRAMLE